MSRKFKWVEWNIDHIGKKGITPEEVESVFDNPASGYPRKIKTGYLLKGKSDLDRLLQIAFVVQSDGQTFVFHARLLTFNEKRNLK